MGAKISKSYIGKAKMLKSKFVSENIMDESDKLTIIGISLVELFISNVKEGYKILYQKGIGQSLIENVIELHKKEIINKITGSSIIPFGDFNIIINYFRKGENILIFITIDKKENGIPYSQLYLKYRKILKDFDPNKNIDTKQLVESSFTIPRIKNVDALFILDNSGIPLISKVNLKREQLKDESLQIGGLISAILLFSAEALDQETGAKLKEIKIGHKVFHLIIRKQVICAFVLQNMTPIIKRYMYLITDQFIDMFSEVLENFDGDTSQFYPFQEIIETYFDF